jgi:pimeloyl-ACP methyl ester carboxylesterase
MSLLAARTPGGIALALRQLRVPWLRRLPMMLGLMAKHPIPDRIIRAWTEPGLRDAAARRDVRKYATSPFTKADLISNTEALQRFSGDALVIWSPENTVMPPEHGQRLADLFPRSRLVQIEDAYVLCMLDQPSAVADEIAAFLTSA